MERYRIQWKNGYYNPAKPEVEFIPDEKGDYWIDQPNIDFFSFKGHLPSFDSYKKHTWRQKVMYNLKKIFEGI